MFPEVFPGRVDQNNPEFVVYQTLRTLPDSYVVLYSKRFKGGLFGKPECEIDFIISNQRDVVVCLEVKGGVLAYDGVQDRWLQNGVIMERSPDRQATEAMHCLLRELSKELRNANVDWALCFPQCSVVAKLGPTGLPLSRIFDESRLVEINSELPKLEQEIRTSYRRKGMTPKETHDLVERLTRSIGFVQILGVRIAREAEQLIQVTEEQCETLADLEINPRMIVHGSAGTGKTVLAQEFAKRLEANGRSVLLLFYNKGIAAKVRFAFDKKSRVSVSTFSSFAKRLVEANDPDWWEVQTNKDDEFWHLVLPSKLLEIHDEKQPKFDAIIIDEGQDFKPEWYEYLQTLLRRETETQFCVFLDEHQDIFGHWKHFPCSPSPAKKVLTKNCRNTKSIVDFLNHAFPTQMGYFERSPAGVPVVERTVQNDVEEQTQIVRDIKQMVGNEGIRPGAIVVLLNSSKEESCLADTKAIAGYPLASTYGGYDPHAKQIYYATIEIFKGLEADVVLLILGNDLSAAEQAKALYVRGSRAKHLLYVYRRDTRGPASHI
jgi:molybdopterin-guanine dinucleotide biosynthesis protein